MSVCDSHNHFEKQLNSLDTKVGDNTKSLAIVMNDVKWLVDDRKEQRDSYYKKKAFMFKVKMTIAGAIITAISVLFTSERASLIAKIAINNWLRS